MRVRSDRRYDLAVGAAELWEVISDVGRYRTWWPWLRRFDAAGLVAGDEWACTVQPPAPYVVRFAIALGEVREPSLVTATLTGDIRGTAALEVTSNGDGGCQARLVSDLAPASRWLGTLARLAPPVVRYGHDWVLDRGVRQFLARAAVPAAD